MMRSPTLAILAMTGAIAIAPPSAEARCPKFVWEIWEWVGRPLVGGAAEELGRHAVNRLMSDPASPGASDSASIEPAPEPAPPEAPAVVTEDYIRDLQSAGVSECEIAAAFQRHLGPPDVQFYNPP